MPWYRIEPYDKGEVITLKPWIPKGGVKLPYPEEAITPRIPVAPSIKHCLASLTGIPHPTPYIYKLISKAKIVNPKDKVPDSKYTGERWILHPATFKRVGLLVIHGNLGLKTASNEEELKQIIKEVLEAPLIVKNGVYHIFDSLTYNLYKAGIIKV